LRRADVLGDFIPCPQALPQHGESVHLHLVIGVPGASSAINVSTAYVLLHGSVLRKRRRI